jgi:AmmeMemoRadiSam system protein A
MLMLGCVPVARWGNLLISETYSPLTLDQKIDLLRIARESIYHFVSRGRAPASEVEDDRLTVPQGVFVSLHINDRLRGCIGTLTGDGPLHATVCDMAVSAASNDPRFAPLRMDEVPRIDIELSILGPLQTVSPKEVEVGAHGLFVTMGRTRGTLLPQVATQFSWSREEFLSQTCVKAGMPPEAWKDSECHIAAFTAEVFAESDIRSGT